MTKPVFRLFLSCSLLLIVIASAPAIGPLGINWQSRETVATGTTDYQDMAGADRYLAFRNGQALIAYFNQSQSQVQLHWRDNSCPCWGGPAVVGNTQPTGNDPGAFPSIAVSSSGAPYVSYVNFDPLDGV